LQYVTGFGNRVLRRIFGPKQEAVKDCMMESFITSMLQKIVIVTKSRRIRFVGYVACMETEICIHNFGWKT
jgi:hypothetical protein